MKISRNYFFGFSLILLLSILCHGQERIRKLEKAFPNRNEPVELVSSEVGNRVFNNENEVLADRDWLRNLKLNLKNISNKTVLYIRLDLEVQPQGKMQNPFWIPLTFGQQSLVNSTNIDVTKLSVLKPNETAKISLKPYHLDSFMQFMQKNEIGEIEHVKVFFEFVIFDDGTAWSKGHLMRRNPNNSKEWDVVGIAQKQLSFFQNPSLFDTTLMLVNGLRGKSIASYLTMNPSFFFQII